MNINFLKAILLLSALCLTGQAAANINPLCGHSSFPNMVEVDLSSTVIREDILTEARRTINDDHLNNNPFRMIAVKPGCTFLVKTNDDHYSVATVVSWQFTDCCTMPVAVFLGNGGDSNGGQGGANGGLFTVTIPNGWTCTYGIGTFSCSQPDGAFSDH